MSSESVHPLRIQKGTPQSSPVKSDTSSLPRPLSELSPLSARRNSPSYNQATKKMVLSGDSSPFQSSPFNASEGNSSPRLFWQGRDPQSPNKLENSPFGFRESTPSPTRRSSIEKLQKASRVKNSSMFAREQKQEYDPTHLPHVERPLAKHVPGNAFPGSGVGSLRSAEDHRFNFAHRRQDSNNPMSSPVLKSPTPISSPDFTRRQSRDQVSPTKSSFAAARFNSRAMFDPETGTWSDENSSVERELPPGRSLHRHAKSVTFDAAPPQVNEYEMATPDLSSIDNESRENSGDSEDDDDYFGRGRDSDEHDDDDSFDASLEDAEKTPVVGPEDWRHADHDDDHDVSHEDPFDGQRVISPMPESTPSPRSQHNSLRNDSIGSNGEHRPLPPLPGMHMRTGSNSPMGFPRAGSPRGLPSPPGPSSLSKADLQGMSGGKMTLEERLRLMMIQDDEKPKSPAELQRERRMRRGAPRERAITPEAEKSHDEIHEDEAEDTLGDISGLGDYQLPPRISRESILRKVNGEDVTGDDSEYDFSSPMSSSTPERRGPVDPDVPIPSTEDDSMLSHDDVDEADSSSIIVKTERDENSVDLNSITEMYQRSGSKEDYSDANENLEDAESHYSQDTPDVESSKLPSDSAEEDEGPPTPRPSSALKESDVDPLKKDGDVALPEFSGVLGDSDFNLGLKSFMTPSPPPVPAKDTEPEATEAATVTEIAEAPEVDEVPEAPEISEVSEIAEVIEEPHRSDTPEKRQKIPQMVAYDGSGWGSEEEDDYEDLEEPGTPESVIRHQVSRSPTPEPMEEKEPLEEPVVPERQATIKAALGSKLKTRPSATPADMLSMREARRVISGELPAHLSIPPRNRTRIPSSHGGSPLENNLPEEDSQALPDRDMRKTSFHKRSLTLDIGEDLSFDLDQDFDRVIEAQKVAFDLFTSNLRSLHETPQVDATSTNNQLEHNANMSPRKQRGYLMRHNTKVVIASSDVGKAQDDIDTRGARSAGNSPVKTQRPESWTVEPWNGNMRRRSQRELSLQRKKHMSGPVPPLPGQTSNASGLGSLHEDEVTEAMVEEGAERGRVFVKVIGVKDLDIPLPKGERTWFSLTLDNGVHCVTTAWLELGRNAPIGQEFELVVPNDLEFQLSLNVKLEKPEPKRVLDSPVRAVKPQKVSTLTRVFASPKKRKEMELKFKEEEQRAAEQRQKDAMAKRASTQPTAWDLLSPLAADDGTFGRSYVCLKDHESRCYGRPYIVDVACFNEWATEEITIQSSVKSKRSTTEVRRRAPYKVGKLELQLLFVPKPKGAKDEDMPKSMNGCIREMKEAEAAQARCHEGHLSQQGGDCPYWRRRFFRLDGSKLTAYHESTRQPRATINLAKASKLIDDKRTLTQKETTGKGGSRRKSGFAEEEEGYMFVEEGFRIRFGNGEVIDFYADTADDKEGWMKVLDQAIGKESLSSSTWCGMVFKKEESARRKAAAAATHNERKSSRQQKTRSMIV